MSTTASVSISRTGLDLPALVITGDGTGTYSLTQGGLGRPLVTPRYTYADTSPDVDGQVLLQVARDTSALPLTLLVQGTTAANLDAALNALEDALWQFTYTATVNVGGVVKVWRCQPTVPQVGDGVIDHARAAQHIEVVSVTIPVDPIPGE